MTPKLTISIPVFNGEKEIRKLLDSIFQQDFDSEIVEVLVSDNCSTDQTKSICLEYIEKLKYFRNSENIGPDKNFAKCIELSNSPYTWMIGHDDYLTPNSINKIISIIDKYEPHSIFLNYSLVSGDLLLREKWISEVNSGLYFNLDSFISEVGTSINFLSAIVHNTEAFKTIDYNKYYGTFWIQLATYLEYSKSKRIYFESQPAVVNAGNSEGGDANVNGMSLRVLLNLYTVFTEILDTTDENALLRVKRDFNRFALKKLISTKRLNYVLSKNIKKEVIDILPTQYKMIFNLLNMVPNRIYVVMYRTKIGNRIKHLLWRNI